MGEVGTVNNSVRRIGITNATTSFSSTNTNNGNSSSRNTVVTISPKSSICIACATEFYEFNLANQRVITEITQLFYETLGLEMAARPTTEDTQFTTSSNNNKQLPFCTNCLLDFNELRQMIIQLKKLNATVAKFKDTLVLSAIDKINMFYEDPNNSSNNSTSRGGGGGGMSAELRQIHQHIKNKSSKQRPSANSFRQLQTEEISMEEEEMDNEAQDNNFDTYSDNSDMPEEYPLFVDIVEEEGTNSNSQPLLHTNVENIEVFDPLSNGNDNSFQSESDPLEDSNDNESDFNGIQTSRNTIPPLLFVGASKNSNLQRNFGSFRRNDIICEPVLSNESNDGILATEGTDWENTETKYKPCSSNTVAVASNFRTGGGRLKPRGVNNNNALGRRVKLERRVNESQSRSMEINFNDPSAFIRDNFTMCPICFKYTLKEGANNSEHNCEQKSSTAHFQCGYCNQISQTEKSLMTHMKQHLNNSQLQNWQCVSDAGHSKLLQVFSTVSGPYSCPYCEAVFSRKSELIRGHMLTRHGIKLKPHPCSVCGSAFRSKNDLDRHFRTHTGERPYSCSYCLKTFTRKHHLKTHLITHERQIVITTTTSSSVQN